MVFYFYMVCCKSYYEVGMINRFIILYEFFIIAFLRFLLRYILLEGGERVL